MKIYLIAFLFLFAGVCGSGYAFSQSEIKPASLSISGEVKNPLTLTVIDMEKLPRISVMAKDRADKEHRYEGVELGRLLANAGVTLGEALKGENLTKYLLVEASDGYQVLFSLPEVDTVFASRKIILAYRKDGAMLSKDEGPFHIVIDGDKRKSRNARQVISLKVLYAK